MTQERRIRVLLAKGGLDGHDVGVKVLTLALRDEGMEVIYIGIRRTAEAIVQTAVQEDVDVVGLSSLSGGHDVFFPRVAELLKKSGRDDVLLIGGGVVPEEDVPALKEMGFKEIFGPGTNLREIAKFIRENVVQPE